jgi:hypothetical protein
MNVHLPRETDPSRAMIPQKGVGDQDKNGSPYRFSRLQSPRDNRIKIFLQSLASNAVCTVFRHKAHKGHKSFQLVPFVAKMILNIEVTTNFHRNKRFNYLSIYKPHGTRNINPANRNTLAARSGADRKQQLADDVAFLSDANATDPC